MILDFVHKGGATYQVGREEFVYFVFGFERFQPQPLQIMLRESTPNPLDH
jgi:hypothetical protein